MFTRFPSILRSYDGHWFSMFAKGQMKIDFHIFRMNDK